MLICTPEDVTDDVPPVTLVPLPNEDQFNCPELPAVVLVLLPVRTSSPAPPVTLSLPTPAVIVSLPDPPVSVSVPKPELTLTPLVAEAPLKVSFEPERVKFSISEKLAVLVPSLIVPPLADV